MRVSRRLPSHPPRSWPRRPLLGLSLTPGSRRGLKPVARFSSIAGRTGERDAKGTASRSDADDATEQRVWFGKNQRLAASLAGRMVLWEREPPVETGGNLA